MTLTTTLILIQQYMTRYVLSIILAFGTLGNLLAIGVYSQKNYRKNSCSIYFIAVSVFGLIAAWWGIVPLIFALDHFDMVNHSLTLCRTRGYILQVTTMCFRYTFILICLDRYASCSSRASIRALCRPQIAYRSIGITSIFWIIASVHLAIFESIENNRCYVYGLYGQIFSFYNLFFSGILPILCMIFISIPVIYNLSRLHNRVQPIDNTRQLNRREIKLTKVVLAEVIAYIVCSFANPIMTIYTTTTNNMILNKSTERKQIESFANFIALSLLLYLNYNIIFYVHFFVSHAYRKEVKKFIMRLIPKRGNTRQNRGTIQQTAHTTRTKQ